MTVEVLLEEIFTPERTTAFRVFVPAVLKALNEQGGWSYVDNGVVVDRLEVRRGDLLRVERGSAEGRPFVTLARVGVVHVKLWRSGDVPAIAQEPA